MKRLRQTSWYIMYIKDVDTRRDVLSLLSALLYYKCYRLNYQFREIIQCLFFFSTKVSVKR